MAKERGSHVVLSLLFMALIVASVLTVSNNARITGFAVESSDSELKDKWSMHQKDDLSKCGEANTDFTYEATITQDGNTIEFFGKRPSGGIMNFFGNIKGHTLDLKGSFLELGGTVTLESSSVSIAEDCRSLDGTFVWSWTDGETRCAGSSSLEGNRLGEGTCRQVCEESWQCGEWSVCVGGVQIRTCIDDKVCGTENSKPEEERVCIIQAAPAPEKSNLGLVAGVVVAVLIAAGAAWYFLKKKGSKGKGKKSKK